MSAKKTGRKMKYAYKIYKRKLKAMNAINLMVHTARLTMEAVSIRQNNSKCLSCKHTYEKNIGGIVAANVGKEEMFGHSWHVGKITGHPSRMKSDAVDCVKDHVSGLDEGTVKLYDDDGPLNKRTRFLNDIIPVSVDRVTQIVLTNPMMPFPKGHYQSRE